MAAGEGTVSKSIGEMNFSAEHYVTLNILFMRHSFKCLWEQGNSRPDKWEKQRTLRLLF